MRCPDPLCAGRLPLARRTLLLALGALSALPLGALPGPLLCAPALALGLATDTAPRIATQPVATTAINAREYANFKVHAYENAYGVSLQYQWQRKDATGDWYNISGANDYTYTTPLPVSLADQGAQFRVVVCNSLGEVITSQPAVLTVHYLTITQQPVKQAAKVSGTATFSVGVNALPAPTYQWQRRAPGSVSWVTLSGATGASCTTPALALGDSGAAYRVVMRNRAGVFISDVAGLEVRKGAPLEILKQPENWVNDIDNPSMFFSVEAGGDPPLHYQWQRYNTIVGYAWMSLPGQNAPRLDFIPGVLQQEWRQYTRYRCVISNDSGTLYSNEVTAVGAIVRFSGKVPDVTAEAGSKASFTAVPHAIPLFGNFFWQLSKDGGSSWEEVPSSQCPVTGPGVLETKVLEPQDNGNLYRPFMYTNPVYAGPAGQLRVTGGAPVNLNLSFEGLPEDVAPLAWICSLDGPPQMVTASANLLLTPGVWSIAPCAIWGTGVHTGQVFQASPARSFKLGMDALTFTVSYRATPGLSLEIPRNGHPEEKVPMSFVWVPAGTFTMGGEMDADFQVSWQLAHRVDIRRGFWMSRTEVTRDQFNALMGDTSLPLEGSDMPMQVGTMADVQEFLRRLGGQVPAPEGCGVFRLPSEAEWEYAHRAGSSTLASFGNAADMSGVFAQCRADAPQRVGQLAPNPWGLYDMNGNLWELCQDTWHASLAGAPEDGTVWSSDPTYSETWSLSVLPSGWDWVVRGGSYRSDAMPHFDGSELRSFYRTHVGSSFGTTPVGFRVVIQ